MPGPRPLPTKLKLVRGNPGKRPLNRNEPQPRADADMPSWLSLEAQEHWPLVATQLRDAGILTDIDAPALALYCEAFARWKNANDQVVKYGAVVKSPNGYPVQSPFLSIANRSFEQMLRLLAEFGMSPASRSRVTATKADDTGPYAKFTKKT